MIRTIVRYFSTPGAVLPHQAGQGPVAPVSAPASFLPFTCRNWGHDPRPTDPGRCLDCGTDLDTRSTL